MSPHTVPVLHAVNIIAPALAGLVFCLLMSLVPEPVRQRFNAILVAGAGAAYLNGGLGPWELLYLIAATPIAYQGLNSYRYIACAWWMHAGWDVVHHLYATPIWPWSPTSSAGCAIFDTVIAWWFFAGAPAPRLSRRRSTSNTGSVAEATLMAASDSPAGRQSPH